MSSGRKTGLSIIMTVMGAMLFWSNLPESDSAFTTIQGKLTHLKIQIDPKFSTKDTIDFKLEGHSPLFSIGPLDIHNAIDLEAFKNEVAKGSNVEITVLKKRLTNKSVSVSSFSVGGKAYIDAQRSRNAQTQNVWIGFAMIILGITLFVMMSFRGLFGEEHVISQAFTAFGIGGTAILFSTLYAMAMYKESLTTVGVVAVLDIILLYWIVYQAIKLRQFMIEMKANTSLQKFFFPIKKSKQNQKNVS
jgi:hypothetical protein